jgi:hypothetical protein
MSPAVANSCMLDARQEIFGLSNERRVWVVQGYDSLTQIFRAKLSPVLSEREMGVLLQRLAARDLSPKEILGASLRKGMKGHNHLLEIRRDSSGKAILYVGNNPHYAARKRNESELEDMEDDEAPRS